MSRDPRQIEYENRELNKQLETLREQNARLEGQVQALETKLETAGVKKPFWKSLLAALFWVFWLLIVMGLGAYLYKILYEGGEVPVPVEQPAKKPEKKPVGKWKEPPAKRRPKSEEKAPRTEPQKPPEPETFPGFPESEPPQKPG